MSPHTSHERDLAQRVAAGDRDAFAELYSSYGGAAFAFLLRTLRDRGAAEDVLQQVFLEVWQRASTFDPNRGTVLTWVMTITRSRAIDHLRRRVPEPIGDAAERVAPLEAVDEVETLVERYWVAALLARLHPDEARMLRMRFYDDLSQTEIAERTGIPLGTVKMRMSTALRRLRAMEADE